MTLFKQGYSPPVLALLALLVSFGLTGCEGDDGTTALPAPGCRRTTVLTVLTACGWTAGADGISCWDLNENGIGDLPDEDINDDGVVDVQRLQRGWQ